MTVRGWTTGTPAEAAVGKVGKISKGPAVSKRSLRARRKTAADLPCVHRGEPVDQGDCPACSGTVTVTIYECASHKRCTIDRAFPGTHLCVGCRERRPPRGEPPPLVPLSESLP